MGFQTQKEYECYDKYLILGDLPNEIAKYEPIERLNVVVDDDSRTICEDDFYTPLLIHWKSGRIYEGQLPITRIGRSIEYNDIGFPQIRTISSKHMEIQCIGGHNYVIDLGSTNGTCINGDRIYPNEAVRVESICELRLAHEEFILVFDHNAVFVRTENKIAVLTEEDTKEKRYVLEDNLVLGRSNPWKKGAMLSRKISRKHAVIFYQNGQYFIRDCNSGNGTYVNHIVLPQDTEINLKSGDMIRIGDHLFVFEIITLS